MFDQLNAFYQRQARSRGEETPPVITPSSEQLPVIAGPLRPTLVVAGAGAGKTWVMSMRVLHLVSHHGVAPSQILGLTFSRKAAAELGANIAGRLGELKEAIETSGSSPQAQSQPLLELDDMEVEASTYNSFAAQIVREYGALIGVEPQTQVIRATRSYQVVDHLVRNWTGDLPDMSVATICEDVLSLESNILDHRLSLEEYEISLRTWLTNLAARRFAKLSALGKIQETFQAQLMLLPLVQAYRDYKRQHQLMDFSDQLAMAYRIVTEFEEIALQIRQRYAAVLLDEFQDTSVMQMDLLSTLFKDMPVTAVGDPNQSIYGFRGASSASLALFGEKFCSDPTSLEQRSLTQARRNYEAVREAANEVAKPLRAYSASLGVNVPPLTAVEGSADSKQADTDRGLVSVAFCGSDRDEAEVIARTIRAWRQREQKTRTTVKAERYAVLAPKWKDLETIREALVNHGIPCIISGYGELLLNPVITDLRAALAAAVDTKDSASAIRLLTNWGMDPDDLKSLHRHARKLTQARGTEGRAHVSLLDAVDHYLQEPTASGNLASERPKLSDAGQRAVSVIASRLRKLRRFLDQPLVHLMTQAVRIFDIDIDGAHDLVTEAEATEAVNQFIDLAWEFANEEEATAAAFLSWLQLMEEHEKLPPIASNVDPLAVELMTIHQSKGLEWDRVVVAATGVKTRSRADERKFEDGEEILAARENNSWMGKRGEIPFFLRQDRQLIHPQTGQKIDLLPQPPSLEEEDYKKLYVAYGRELAHHARREQRCRDYVAYTRAAKELLITGSWYTNLAVTPNLAGDDLVQLLSLQIARELTVEQIWNEDNNAPTPLLRRCPHRNPNTAAHTESYPTAAGAIRQSLEALGAQVEDKLTVDPQPVTQLQQVETALQNLDLKPNSDLYQWILAVAKQHLLHKNNAGEPTDLQVQVSHLSASSAGYFLADPQDFALSIRRPLPQEPSDALTLGTAFHQWAEKWCGQAGQISPVGESETADATMGTTPEANLSFAEVPHHLRSQVEHFAKIAVALFGDKPANVEAVEAPFAVRIGGINVRVQVDLLLREGDGLKVVDWKTSAPPQEGKLGRARQYAVQMEIYRRAVSSAYQLDPSKVGVELVFLGGHSPLAQRVVSLEKLNQLLPDFDFESEWKQASGAVEDTYS
ncbi:MAG: UvrD-helicase domain-containing protein [Actinomycetaceae bacterium]|nr:UvrD-helicase domain-containing protein [Actinomycetaceae bacterium]